MADDALVWEASPEGLAPGLQDDLERAAQAYRARTGGGPLRITSGLRTLQHQAQLMADMTREQIEGMYCRSGYPDYARRLVALREARGEVTPEQAYEILRTRTEGYISSHLSGAAVDIDTDGVDVAALAAILQEHGFSTLDERHLGLACLHASYRASPPRIVRE